MSHPFNQFNLQPYLIHAVDEIGFKEPTDIQAQVIPVIQQGRSVIGQSQTGSGKSHAFLLPIMDKIDPDKQEVQAVITAPSRELAEQLYEKALELASYSDKVFVTFDDYVPDPYFSGHDGFEYVLDVLEDACEGLLNFVQAKKLI